MKITKKDIVLDYSQLRIGCFHFLLCSLPKGSYVASSCYTIYDIANVIINAGHFPYFVDIEKNNLGANINQPDNAGKTPAIGASENGRTECLSI